MFHTKAGTIQSRPVGGKVSTAGKQYHPGLVLILVLVGVLVMSVLPTSAQSDPMLPDKITVNTPGRFPEGIEWDAAGQRFLLTSLADGSVISVTDDGTVTPFAAAPEAGLWSIGVHIDATTKRALVAYGDGAALMDPTAKGRAALGIFDLETGDQLYFIDLGGLYDGKHLANDVTVDADGNAYVTDSFSPVIYKVAPDGTAEVFAQDARLGVPNGGFGLNGIDFVPDGYLLATVDGTATLWKVSTQDGTDISEVKLSEPFGADGMVILPDGTLAVMAQVLGTDGNTTGTIAVVSSSDAWQSAEITRRFTTDGVSTLAYRDGEVYAIYSLLGQLGSPNAPESFDIQRIVFPEQ